MNSSSHAPPESARSEEGRAPHTHQYLHSHPLTHSAALTNTGGNRLGQQQQQGREEADEGGDDSDSSGSQNSNNSDHKNAPSVSVGDTAEMAVAVAAEGAAVLGGGDNAHEPAKKSLMHTSDSAAKEDRSPKATCSSDENADHSGDDRRNPPRRHLGGVGGAVSTREREGRSSTLAPSAFAAIPADILIRAIVPFLTPDAISSLAATSVLLRNAIRVADEDIWQPRCFCLWSALQAVPALVPKAAPPVPPALPYVMTLRDEGRYEALRLQRMEAARIDAIAGGIELRGEALAYHQRMAAATNAAAAARAAAVTTANGFGDELTAMLMFNNYAAMVVDATPYFSSATHQSRALRGLFTAKDDTGGVGAATVEDNDKNNNEGGTSAASPPTSAAAGGAGSKGRDGSVGRHGGGEEFGCGSDDDGGVGEAMRRRSYAYFAGGLEKIEAETAPPAPAPPLVPPHVRIMGSVPFVRFIQDYSDACVDEQRQRLFSAGNDADDLLAEMKRDAEANGGDTTAQHTAHPSAAGGSNNNAAKLGSPLVTSDRTADAHSPHPFHTDPLMELHHQMAYGGAGTTAAAGADGAALSRHSSDPSPLSPQPLEDAAPLPLTKKVLRRFAAIAKSSLTLVQREEANRNLMATKQRQLEASTRRQQQRGAGGAKERGEGTGKKKTGNRRTRDAAPLPPHAAEGSNGVPQVAAGSKPSAAAERGRGVGDDPSMHSAALRPTSEDPTAHLAAYLDAAGNLVNGEAEADGETPTGSLTAGIPLLGGGDAACGAASSAEAQGAAVCGQPSHGQPDGEDDPHPCDDTHHEDWFQEEADRESACGSDITLWSTSNGSLEREFNHEYQHLLLSEQREQEELEEIMRRLKEARQKNRRQRRRKRQHPDGDPAQQGEENANGEGGAGTGPARRSGDGADGQGEAEGGDEDIDDYDDMYEAYDDEGLPPLNLQQLAQHDALLKEGANPTAAAAAVPPPTPATPHAAPLSTPSAQQLHVETPISRPPLAKAASFAPCAGTPRRVASLSITSPPLGPASQRPPSPTLRWSDLSANTQRLVAMEYATEVGAPVVCAVTGRRQRTHRSSRSGHSNRSVVSLQSLANSSKALLAPRDAQAARAIIGEHVPSHRDAGVVYEGGMAMYSRPASAASTPAALRPRRGAFPTGLAGTGNLDIHDVFALPPSALDLPPIASVAAQSGKEVVFGDLSTLGRRRSGSRGEEPDVEGQQRSRRRRRSGRASSRGASSRRSAASTAATEAQCEDATCSSSAAPTTVGGLSEKESSRTTNRKPSRGAKGSGSRSSRSGGGRRSAVVEDAPLTLSPSTTAVTLERRRSGRGQRRVSSRKTADTDATRTEEQFSEEDSRDSSDASSSASSSQSTNDETATRVTQSVVESSSEGEDDSATVSSGESASSCSSGDSGDESSSGSDGSSYSADEESSEEGAESEGLSQRGAESREDAHALNGTAADRGRGGYNSDETLDDEDLSPAQVEGLRRMYEGVIGMIAGREGADQPPQRSALKSASTTGAIDSFARAWALNNSRHQRQLERGTAPEELQPPEEPQPSDPVGEGCRGKAKTPPITSGSLGSSREREACAAIAQFLSAPDAAVSSSPASPLLALPAPPPPSATPLPVGQGCSALCVAMCDGAGGREHRHHPKCSRHVTISSESVARHDARHLQQLQRKAAAMVTAMDSDGFVPRVVLQAVDSAACGEAAAPALVEHSAAAASEVSACGDSVSGSSHHHESCNLSSAAPTNAHAPAAPLVAHSTSTLAAAPSVVATVVEVLLEHPHLMADGAAVEGRLGLITPHQKDCGGASEATTAGTTADAVSAVPVGVGGVITMGASSAYPRPATPIKAPAPDPHTQRPHGPGHKTAAARRPAPPMTSQIPAPSAALYEWLTSATAALPVSTILGAVDRRLGLGAGEAASGKRLADGGRGASVTAPNADALAPLVASRIAQLHAGSTVANGALAPAAGGESDGGGGAANNHFDGGAVSAHTRTPLPQAPPRVLFLPTAPAQTLHTPTVAADNDADADGHFAFEDNDTEWYRPLAQRSLRNIAGQLGLWKHAYVSSIRDAKQTSLSKEEILHINWEMTITAPMQLPPILRSLVMPNNPPSGGSAPSQQQQNVNPVAQVLPRLRKIPISFDTDGMARTDVFPTMHYQVVSNGSEVSLGHLQRLPVFRGPINAATIKGLQAQKPSPKPMGSGSAGVGIFANLVRRAQEQGPSTRSAAAPAQRSIFGGLTGGAARQSPAPPPAPLNFRSHVPLWSANLEEQAERQREVPTHSPTAAQHSFTDRWGWTVGNGTLAIVSVDIPRPEYVNLLMQHGA